MAFSLLTFFTSSDGRAHPSLTSREEGWVSGHMAITEDKEGESGARKGRAQSTSNEGWSTKAEMAIGPKDIGKNDYECHEIVSACEWRGEEASGQKKKSKK